MEDTPSPTTGKWIQRRLWLRWLQLFYGILFVWAAVLGFARGSWKWALWPFLALAAFYIFRSWLIRKEPDIGGKLAFFLAISVLLHNVVGTGPWFTRNFPHVTRAIGRLQGGTDVTLSVKLTPCDDGLQRALAKYAEDSQDVEGTNLQKAFDALLAKKRAGTFDPVADGAREQDLLNQYKRLSQRSAELKQMILRPECAGADGSLSGPTSAAQARSTSAEANGIPNQEGARRDDREQRLEEFRTLVNSTVDLVHGKRNIAILVETSASAGGFSAREAFYGHLRSEDANFITDLFRSDISRAGYFNDIFDGDREMLRLATGTSHVDFLVLGKLAFAVHKGSEIDNDLFSSEINLACKVVNPRGEIVRADSLRAVGPGYSENAALDRGIEIISDQFLQRVLKPVL